MLILEDKSSPVNWPKPSEETSISDPLKDSNYNSIYEQNLCSAELEVSKFQKAKENVTFAEAKSKFE